MCLSIAVFWLDLPLGSGSARAGFGGHSACRARDITHPSDQSRSCSSRDLPLQDMADFQAITEIHELVSGALLTNHAETDLARPLAVKETNGRC